MGDAARHLLKSFDALSEADRREVLEQLLRRAAELPYRFLEDELVQAADTVFQEFDRREAKGKEPLRGEVYMVDLGFAAKVRPCLVVSVPSRDRTDSGNSRTAHHVATSISLRNNRRVAEILEVRRFRRPGHRHRAYGTADEPSRHLTADQMRAVERHLLVARHQHCGITCCNGRCAECSSRHVLYSRALEDERDDGRRKRDEEIERDHAGRECRRWSR